MKFAETRIYADPETAARKLVEIASTIEPVQDGRIHIEKINAPFLYESAERRPSMALASTWRSSAVGCGCTKAAPMLSSHKRVPTCSPNWDAAVAVTQAVLSNP